MNNIELLDSIIELRSIKSLVSNYIESKPDSDGRLHTEFSFTETGRFSSHESETEEGTHLQNVPPIIRKMFIADPGMVLVEADKKQGEVMIVAWLAQEERMKRVFKSGGDIHQFNADNLKCDRGFAKTRTHGWDYGLQAKNDIEAEARTKYFQLYPRILLWQEKVAQEVREYRVLVNCFGRRRMFFERIGNKLDQEAWAYIPQSSLSDDTKRGELELWFRGESKLQILNDGHDSVLWQVKELDLEWSIKLAKESLERAFLCGGDLLTIPIGIKIGKNWGEMHELG